MLSLKPSKHRCRCYSQESSSFLYGLRRDAPSTDRVLLERLLNILSRAAAHKNKNPQRLWAESERPDWWTQVTQLKWKNPREHPKDNKDILKKKIDVLERELKERHLMTKELEEEVTTFRFSKKIDLELKSDFEAIITKASGLHFMLDKVDSKMGQPRIISEKMTTYIRETKHCVDKISKRIDNMYEQVQRREERKSSLWASMGVSKQQPCEISEDLDTDTFDLDIDLESACLAESDSDVLSPMISATSLRPFPRLPPLTSVEQQTASQRYSQPVLDGQSFFTSIQNPESIYHPIQSVTKSHTPPNVSQPKSSSPAQSSLDKAVPIQTSVSAQENTQEASDTIRVLDLSEMRSVSISISSATKPNRLYHENEPQLRKVVEPEDEDSDVLIMEQESSPIPAVLPQSPPQSGRDLKRLTESKPERYRFFTKHRQSPYSSVSLKSSPSGLRSPTTVQSRHSFSPIQCFDDTLPLSSLGAHVTTAWRGKRDANAVSSSSITRHDREDRSLPSDVVEDAGVDDMLEDVEAILEDSDTPTMGMYTLHTSEDIAQLADMTRTMSCDDLTPSVTVSVMTNDASDRHSFQPLYSRTSQEKQTIQARTLGTESGNIPAAVSQGPANPGPSRLQTSVSLVTRAEHYPHRYTRHAPETVSKQRQTSSKPEHENKSLSRAIGSLSGTF